jgi:hypothetical protein
MNEQQSTINDLEDFAFEIARLCRSGFPINVQDMAIIQLCHRELDRISEQMLEDEEGWNNEKQHEAEENRFLNCDAIASVRSVMR